MSATLDLTVLLGNAIDADLVKDRLQGFGQPDVTPIADEIYYEFREAGFSLTASRDSAQIVAAHMYPDSLDGYRQFSGRLPANLSFGEERRAVRERLGQPLAFGGGTEGAPAWERYDSGAYACHIEYGATGEVGLVTIMTTAAVPPLEQTAQRH